MKPFSLDDLPEHVKRLNPGLMIPVKAAESLVASDVPEKMLQEACEAWLVRRGYCRRSEKTILEGKPKRGWFVHLHEAQGNPIVLDLLILGNDGRFLEVELKTSTGRVRKAQAELVRHGGTLVRDVPAFVGAVLKWEDEGVKKCGVRSAECGVECAAGEDSQTGMSVSLSRGDR
jgi:hypothetical protein